jgi:prepilin-type processing-associated H-X9-DG protein
LTVNYGRNNYVASAGNTGWFLNTASTIIAGPFHRDSKVSTADILDGTTNTGMFSECRRGLNGTAINPPETMLNTYSYAWTSPGANDLNRPAICNTPSGTGLYYSGLQFFRGAIIVTAWYTHTTTPNSKQFDCTSTGFQSGHKAPRSYHPGGVNMAFCDASVKFVSDNIALPVWRSLGSRAGGEPSTPLP